LLNIALGILFLGTLILLEKERHRSRPVALALVLPTLMTKKGIAVPNTPLSNDLVYTIPVVGKNEAGNFGPLPPGDVVSAVASDPTSLGVTVGATASGAPAIVATPLKQNATGVSVTITDTSGLAQDIAVFDIVPDVDTVLALDFANETTSPQAVPPS
jgi:hypothetical protein